MRYVHMKPYLCGLCVGNHEAWVEMKRAAEIRYGRETFVGCNSDTRLAMWHADITAEIVEPRLAGQKS